jgi:hypothetical protein
MGFGHSFGTAGKQAEAGGFKLFQPVASSCEALVDRAESAARRLGAEVRTCKLPVR